MAQLHNVKYATVVDEFLLALEMQLSAHSCIRRWRFTYSHLAFGLSFYFALFSPFSLSLSLRIFHHIFLSRSLMHRNKYMLQFFDTLNDFDGKSIFLCYSTRAFNLNLCGFKRLSDQRRYIDRWRCINKWMCAWVYE